MLEGLWHRNGTLDVPKLRLLSRTYPQAVAGAIVSLNFDPLSAAFSLVFSANPNITAPTIIFLNRELFYPRGANVAVTPANSLTWHQGDVANRLFFEYGSGVTAGQNITIAILAV